MGRILQPGARKGGPDLRIAEIAAQQRGLVTLGQLRATGLSDGAVAKRVARGRLHRVHQGVFAVGHPAITEEARCAAAVLACGDQAALSHMAGGWWWGLGLHLGPEIDVTVRRSGRPGPKGVRIHRPRRLHDDDVVQHNGLLVTSVSRTLLDLGDLVSRGAVRTALAQAEVARVLDVVELTELVERTRSRRGLAVLRAFVARATAERPVRSVLETALHDLCRRHGLRDPAINKQLTLAGVVLMPDLLFREEKVIVECDGAAVHHTMSAFENDRERDAFFAQHGYLVVRITWRRLRDEPAAVARQLAAILAGRRALLGLGPDS